MTYKAIISTEADNLRGCFIDGFVNKTSKYYKSKLKLGSHFDGWRYNGYLWEALLDPKIVSRDEALRICQTKDSVYVMWDLRTEEKTAIGFRRKYPAEMIMETTGEILVEQLEKDFSGQPEKAVLPSEIYIFDKTLDWYAAFTVETVKINNRYEYMCLTNI